MSESPLAKYTSGARLERQLRTLKPGESFRMTRETFHDVSVPANPLDRQTPEYLARWFHVRMPFYCTLHHNAIGDYWEISRPPVRRGATHPAGLSHD